MPRASPGSGPASPTGRRQPSWRGARALVRTGLRARGWVWLLSMLWVAIGAGGAGYTFVCTVLGCTTNQCANETFFLPQWDREPVVIILVGGLAAGVWLLLAFPLLVAGFVRLRGWRLRNWLRAATWAGAWIAGFALTGLAMFSALAWANSNSGAPNVAWGELPTFAAWPALGAGMTRILDMARRAPGTSGAANAAAARADGTGHTVTGQDQRPS